MNGAVNLDVNIFSDSVGSEVSGQVDCPLLSETSGEQVPGASPHSVSCRHLPLLCNTTLREKFLERKMKKLRICIMGFLGFCCAKIRFPDQLYFGAFGAYVTLPFHSLLGLFALCFSVGPFKTPS